MPRLSVIQFFFILEMRAEIKFCPYSSFNW